MSLRITICDISVRERIVELPDNCPKCGVALRETGLVGWEYQDQKRSMSVREDGTIDYAEDGWGPEGGESFISYVTLLCECGEFLVEGEMSFEPPTQTPPPEPARLDEDRSAKPKTRLVGHARAGKRVGPGLVQPDAIEDTSTGERTSLAPKNDAASLAAYVSPDDAVLDRQTFLSRVADRIHDDVLHVAEPRRYTVRETGNRQVVAGLDSVSADNALVMRLAPETPLAKLEVHEKTHARRDGCVYEIIRVS